VRCIKERTLLSRRGIFVRGRLANEWRTFTETPQLDIPINPCVPSPCGPNSVCREIGNTPACSCLNNYIGRPPNCRPECTINAECPGNLACLKERCKDPCPGSCGIYATCTTVNHSPQCNCEPGYTGDPFAGCSVIPQSTFASRPRVSFNALTIFVVSSCAYGRTKNAL